MDEHDHEGTFSERFRTFRKALHLESPLEFSVVLFVGVCLLGAAGIWLRVPNHRWYLTHDLLGQILHRKQQKGANGADAGAGQADAGAVQGPPVDSAGAAPGVIRITKQKPVGTTNNELPNGLEIVLVPDRIMTPAAMTLKFTGEVGEIHSSIDSADVMDAQSGILISSPDTVVLEWRTPPFGPFAPLLLTVFSKDKIKLEKAVSIPYRYPYEGGDLK
jgi:hypothetical protein